MVLERLFALPQDPPKPIALPRASARAFRLKEAPKATAEGRGRHDKLGRDLQQLRDTTGQVVGSVFYGTMLRAMRESEFKGKYGHGGRGEEVFAAQLHGILAERAGGATAGSVGEAVFDRLSHQQGLISKGKLDGAV